MKWFGWSKKGQKDRRGDSSRQGSLSEPNQRVISYYTASRRQLDNFERTTAYNEDAISHRKRLRLGDSWFVIVCSIVGIAAVLYSATLDTVPHVVVQGQSFRSAAEYQKLVGSEFNNDARNKFKPTLQVASLESAIRKQIPEASQVTVSSSLLGHRPNVKIFTDSPVAIFNQPGSTDLLLSNRGRLLLPSATTTLDINGLPLIQNQTGVKGEAGQQFMRPDEAVAFSRLLAQFKADNSTPIFTLSLTPHELLARESGRGLAYDERFLLNEDITLQYGALRATQNKLTSTSQVISEYIDVRLVERVFYK